MQLRLLSLLALAVAGGLRAVSGLLVPRWAAATRLRRPGAPAHAQRPPDPLQTAAHYAAVLSHISQGLVMYDQHERVVVANRRYCELYGVSERDIPTGSSFREMIDCLRAAGNFAGHSPTDVYAIRMKGIKLRAKTTVVEELRPGMTVRIQIEPLPGGAESPF